MQMVQVKLLSSSVAAAAAMIVCVVVLSGVVVFLWVFSRGGSIKGVVVPKLPSGCHFVSTDTDLVQRALTRIVNKYFMI